MKKKILITGASGFIGSFLTEEALARGWGTWAGVRKSSSKSYLQYPELHFIDLNYADKEKLKDQILQHTSHFGKWDYVIHNAGVTKCIRPEDFDKINHHYTVNLIDAFRETGNIPNRFLYMSSLSVFGEGDEINYTPFRLNDIPLPNTAYGKSKLAAENYLESLVDFPFMILRPTGVYGPREKDYFLMIKAIKNGLDASVGFKPQCLTFIYVKDLVRAAYLALQSPEAGKAYFVADGDVYTDKEFTQLVKEILNKKFVISIRFPLFLLKIISILAEKMAAITGKTSTLNRDKYIIMKQRNWKCDTSSIRKDLNFTPHYNLSDGLRETIEWYKENNWL